MSTSSGAEGATKSRPKRSRQSEKGLPALRFSAVEFRQRLNDWYRVHARELPWRGIDDPYATWLSEIMLQQTRVATVIDRYQEFLLRFPTISALAAADEAAVLALWSGLGYYRRARMLHRGAQFVQREMQGRLPASAMELRRLPGVGEYTSAAIASIAFGENVAVLDGNVERVLLRLIGEPEEKSAKARSRLVTLAQKLLPPSRSSRSTKLKEQGQKGNQKNPAGDHNQAMMELGATICLPRSPLCMQCPVLEFCRTRGEHVTSERTKMLSRDTAHLLVLRKRGIATEVLLERRSPDASLMAGMMELPQLPMDAIEGREPALRVRHAITNTNYYVQIFTESLLAEGASSELREAYESGEPEDGGENMYLVGPAPESSLMAQIPAARSDLAWVPTTMLPQLPLTGLARKAMQRLRVMPVPRLGTHAKP